MISHTHAATRFGLRLLGGPAGAVLVMAATFVVAALAFFSLNGRESVSLFQEMVMGAFGDSYSFSETLVKTAPILLTALAVALPARLGLISVGGEGQLYLGALFGTGAVLAVLDQPGWLLMPFMLAGAMAGGALWGVIPGLLKTRLGVNETISTLLLNYVGVLLVSFVVHGPWKNPNSLGWPATIEFPDGAILPQFFDTRVHLGLVFGIVAAVVLHVLVTRSRWGLGLQVSRSNPRVAATAGISYERNVLIVMAVGGLLAGLAGIAEASVIQNRLQDGLASGYGMTGFLVAWLAGQHFLRLIPLSVLMGGLLASADSLQLYAQLPKASADILQALLFIIVLAVASLWPKHRGA
ncbi:ABC transporter permease [Hydrocarboniclastica marina]|nr:ABC transporter permease [Hydrocarboniclastica marina]|tara:strand:- start:501 stop:1559 length:1059 start_codon:yes stop_codon:yes gene_type:complete